MRCTHGQRDVRFSLGCLGTRYSWFSAVHMAGRRPSTEETAGEEGLVRRETLHSELLRVRRLHNTADAGPDPSAAHGDRRRVTSPRLETPQVRLAFTPRPEHC